MPGDVEVPNASAIMADYKKAIEQAEGDRRNRKEIHRRDGFPVIVKKGQTPLRWLGGPRGSLPPAGDCSLGNLESQHEQSAMNATCTASRVFGSHAEDQIPYLLRGRSSPSMRPDSRNPRPIETETHSVPAGYGFRRNDDQALLPTRPGSPSDDPEEQVKGAEIGPRMAPS
jgi:hypothetical protein